MDTPTTEPSNGPTSYSIEKLLSQSVQPFPDLPPEDFAVLKESIDKRGLINPICLTGDGYLFDGHPRLKALVALGRQRVNAKDVRIASKVNRENMLGYALASNMVRRMTSTEEKVGRMHECVRRGWSQRKIAKEFHVSQPAVSQLMARYPDPDAPPIIITEGGDGKNYVKVKPTPRPVPKPWQYGGKGSEAVQRVRKLLDGEAVIGLDRWEMGQLRDSLIALKGDVDRFLAGLDEHLSKLYPDA